MPLSYVEPTIFRREISPEVRAYVEYLKQVRFTNARYTLIDSDGERAHVRWSATMAYTLDLGSLSPSKSADQAVSGDRLDVLGLGAAGLRQAAVT